MKYIRYITCCLCYMLSVLSAKTQLYKIDIDKKISSAEIIVEGKVIKRQSFWNDAHNIIYTANTIQIYKLFKGSSVSAQIEVLTQGGSVDGKCLIVSDLVQLQKDDIGMFFCFKNKLQMRSPFTKSILYDIYSSDQGFLRYDLKENIAYAPFVKYNIETEFYALIKQHTNTAEKVIDPSFELHSVVVSNGTTGTLSNITSFAPASVDGGAINDPANNILTINGSGFGANPSGSAAVKFKDANSNNAAPAYKVAYTSPYIISWADDKIVLNVPDQAATGKFAVVLNDGTVITSASDLNVFYSVLDAEFNLSGKDIVKEPRLMNTNGSGGYTFQYSTSTAGGGKDFSASPAKQSFLRAVATWKDLIGANLTEGSPTVVQKIDDDNINLVVFDNNNTGVPNMADGVLEATYSWFSACTQSANQLFTAQKTGFDILIRNDGVSQGNIPVNDNVCFPALGSYDLEMIILHELGHALNLGHINDDYENGGGNESNINPSKLMHYAILDYVDRRSPDASAYQGALYTSAPQHNMYGSCGLFSSELTPLAAIVADNNECPSTFPATALPDNTTVFFDLVHATSNKFIDPSFKQINCKNTGTSVTNNAYYAFMNGSNSALSLQITGYTTFPPELSGCNGQGIRLALYDVSACPQGQNYPQPAACNTFSGNGTIDLSGLQSNHKYLLYFDGVRNTKTSFSLTFNGNGIIPVNDLKITIGPNPLSTGILNIKIENATGTQYQYAIFDMAGKMLTTVKIDVVQASQTFPIALKNISAGMYILKLVNAAGNTVATKKIIK